MGADDTEELSLVKQMLVEKIETLKELDAKMADLVPDDELEEEIERADEYMQGVYRILAKIKKALVPATHAANSRCYSSRSFCTYAERGPYEDFSPYDFPNARYR